MDGWIQVGSTRPVRRSIKSHQLDYLMTSCTAEDSRGRIAAGSWSFLSSPLLPSTARIPRHRITALCAFSLVSVSIHAHAHVPAVLMLCPLTSFHPRASCQLLKSTVDVVFGRIFTPQQPYLVIVHAHSWSIGY